MGEVEFRLLGTVGAWRGDQAVQLGHGRRRCVLAALLVDANQVVSAEQLLDRAWGDGVPRQGRDTLYTYLSRLRQVFRGLDVEITRRSGGYVLAVDPQSVDLHRFRGLVARGRSESALTSRLALFDQAVALWRGEAFAGMGTPWLDNVRENLVKERFGVDLDRVDLRLALGRHGELVTSLAAAVREHPLDERLTRQYMLALYRSGRQAEALAAYQALRDRLADALGVDPLPEVQRLHTALLRQAREVAPPVDVQPPAQVPGVVPHFVGRAEELRELGRPVSVIVGTAGVGKSALAAQWAHLHSAEYPDGQLYVNLRGYDAAEPMCASVALEGFLRALGAERIPPGLAERSALYRSALAGLRMVVVLDNARSVDQVRPLLPGRHGGVVLVTSQDDLTGLVVRNGAHRITVGRLTERESLDLLRQMRGDRVDAELPAAVEVARRCAGLPLALRVAAQRSARLADVVVALNVLGDLDALDVPGDPASSVRSVFSWSYQALPRSAARLFRLLGSRPAHSAAAAAALAGVDLPAARRSLDVLRAAHLVEQTAADRFEMHDLLRRYAQQLDADPLPHR
ncbi:BTAD domain-containing putative transcriptional regulator [Lentzea sp. JNUCC 0626]|uniref:AfsR/SARP family transcriptional regulator n=1 Tax=Lentzea sp. JNUCC 0626 TaxID=3367513 RepID=UPI003747FD6F